MRSNLVAGRICRTRSTYAIELQFTVAAFRDATQLLLVDVGQTVAWRLNAGEGGEGGERRVRD